MRTTIHLQPPFNMRVEHFDREGGGEFATVDFAGNGQKAVLFLYSRAECDMVVRAVLQAKDMLPAEYVEQPPPDAGDSDPGGAS